MPTIPQNMSKQNGAKGWPHQIMMLATKQDYTTKIGHIKYGI